MKVTFLLLTVFLIFATGITISRGSFFKSNNAVLLRDIEVLTLRKGEWTTGRRNSPIPQLACVSGNACKESHRVDTIQCKNVGFDGEDVNWKCESVLDQDIKLGMVNVLCEGYDSPNDPYILRGSCGAEYELEYTNLRKPEQTTTYKKTTTKYYQPFYDDEDDLTMLPVYVFGCFMAIVFSCILCSDSTSKTRTTVYSSEPTRRYKKTTVTSPVPDYEDYEDYEDETYQPTYQPKTRSETTINETHVHHHHDNRSSSDFTTGVMVGTALNNRKTPTHSTKETTVIRAETPNPSINSSTNSSTNSSANSTTHTSESHAKTKRR